MSQVDLLFDKVKDEESRENFQKLDQAFKITELLQPDWTFYEVEFNSAVSNQKIPHNLGYVPKDVIVTSVSDGETATFNYDSFDTSYIYITVTGDCTVRFFLGTFSRTTT